MSVLTPCCYNDKATWGLLCHPHGVQEGPSHLAYLNAHVCSLWSLRDLQPAGSPPCSLPGFAKSPLAQVEFSFPPNTRGPQESFSAPFLSTSLSWWENLHFGKILQTEAKLMLLDASTLY